MNPGPVNTPRHVERVVEGQPTTDGAGVKLMRVLTHDLQHRLDPFLMLDNFSTENPADYIAGFPNHPHRGFETITYMVAGRMRHRDSAGHEGLLSNGGVQWMTAGRGLIHSEIPEQEAGAMEGFQLWLNLPARDKMCEPSYRDIPGPTIPEFVTPKGVRVRVISGESHGVHGAVQRPIAQFPTDTLYLDLHFPAGPDLLQFTQSLPAHYNALLYVYRGSLRVAGTIVPRLRMAILANEGDGVAIDTLPDPKNSTGARALLIAGQPLGEPIAQYGPFVMNTHQQLMQAVEDFQQGRLG